MRRIALIAALIAATGAFAAAFAGADDSHTYKIQMYNAFGIVEGSEVKVAGVPSGTVESLDVNEEKQAELTVKLSGPLSVLGEDTTCSTEPQSLIAEYFIDCDPKGPQLPEEGIVPAGQVRQTVQNDLVLSTMRLPFRQRFQLLINEFGTALAGNPENLNEAIRLGAPALEDLHKALKLLADQNEVITRLNVDSDEIIGKLTERRDDVVRFIQSAGDAAVASAERRDDLSTDFDLLDNALAELGPTMRELENVAVESTPLLADLRAAAPGLNTLAVSLPAFSRATERSLDSLGEAAVPGRTALVRGRDEIALLAESGRAAPSVADNVAKFLQDIDDPRRAVEQDTRSMRTCNDKTRACWSTGRRNDNGYTGMEGLLNYLYYQAGALNQFDEVGHLLHFSLYDVFVGPCGAFNARQDVPMESDNLQRTTDPALADDCVGWLGPNQPGINQDVPGLGPYHPSVCPEGSNDLDICDPNGPARAPAETNRRSNAAGGATGSGDASVDLDDVPLPPTGLPGAPDEVRDQLEDLLNAPNDVLDQLGGGGSDDRRGGRAGAGVNQAAEDLLDFLFSP